MRWQVHGERTIYDSTWVRLALVDVEIPGGERFDHHVVRMPNQAAGAIVYDRALGVLVLWRHRFITDTWGYEIPAGGMNPGETPEQAAARETLEETGWRPGPLRPLMHFNPTNGISDQVFHTFVADGADHVGDPTDAGESERIEWVPLAELRRIVRANEMLDGMSLTAVTYALASASSTSAGSSVQFSPDLRDGVRSGRITVSFRLWSRPKVKVGGRYALGPSYIEVDAIEMVPFSSVTRADVRRAGETDRDALRQRAAHAGPIDDDTLVYRVEFHVVDPV